MPQFNICFSVPIDTKMLNDTQENLGQLFDTDSLVRRRGAEGEDTVDGGNTTELVSFLHTTQRHEKQTAIQRILYKYLLSELDSQIVLRIVLTEYILTLYIECSQYNLIISSDKKFIHLCMNIVRTFSEQSDAEKQCFASVEGTFCEGTFCLVPWSTGI